MDSGRRAMMWAGAVLLAVMAGCGQAPDAGPSPAGPPDLDTGLVATGRPLYDQYCAQCHGFDGAGDPDWKIPHGDGSFRPPPHDGTGHTWHHSDRLLVDLIADGSDFPQSRMPAFGDVLDDDAIVAILAYIKTWWGPEERSFQWEVSQRDPGDG